MGERTSREVEILVGLPPCSVRTIHNGVPDGDYPTRPRLRAGALIGAVGRLEQQKGFDVLIRSLADVDHASLVVVGEGSERAGLEELARRVGVAERIVWTGWENEPRGYLPREHV